MADLAVIGLGSNLGRPLENLRSARVHLERCGRIAAASSIYRTVPVGGPSGQSDYLNAVLAFEPGPAFETPHALLELMLGIERDHGRLRRVVWEARTLDLDLLGYGSRVMDEPGLTLPHPRLLQRPFVLAPLCEVLPTWTHPVERTRACEALARLSQEGIERTEMGWEAG